MALQAVRVAVAKAMRGNHHVLQWEDLSAARRLYWLGLADICLNAIAAHNRENSMASRLMERLHEIGVHAWLQFVQALNMILVSLLGSALVIHQAYPQLIAGMIGKLPPAAGIPLIILFGVVIHYALRRAKKAA